MSNASRSKKICLSLIGLTALTILIFVLFSLFASPIANANVDVTSSSVKVFVGDMASTPSGYAASRSAYLSELSSSDGIQEFSAVVGLNDYFTVSEVNDLMQKYEGITIKRIYMWPKGETGRLSLIVENGDIEESIKNYAARHGKTVSYIELPSKPDGAQ